jgi:hypothetical protein
VEQHYGNQLNDASIGALDPFPCSHGVCHIGDVFQRLRSSIVLPKIIIRSVAMLVEIFEDPRNHQKIIGLILNRTRERSVY